MQLGFLYQYGFLILMGLLMTGVLGYLIGPPYYVILSWLQMTPRKRVVSGMRPTGQLHLGHLVGALQNWVALQEQYDCFYFVADWHALTTDYADTSQLTQYAYDNAIDWIAAGLDPERSTFFVQSMVPEHAELYLLLAMMTPGLVARAGADLQGAAGSAERQRSVIGRVPRLSAASDGRRGASTTATSFRSATIRWRISSWRARSCAGSTVSTATCWSSRSRC